MIYFIHIHHVTSRYVYRVTESHYLDNGWARPYCGVLGYSFILRLCRRWNEGSLYNSLKFSGEAHGFGGLSDQCDLIDYDICFVQIGENDVKTAKNDSLGLNTHKLMPALINIVEEFQRQGVRRVVFGSLFLKHHSVYNKRCNWLNKLLRKHARCEYYKRLEPCLILTTLYGE